MGLLTQARDEDEKVLTTSSVQDVRISADRISFEVDHSHLYDMDD